MSTKLLRNPITRFLCWLVLAYAILAAPWPGLNRAYGCCFRAVCRMVFPADDGRRELSFEAPEAGSARLDDTRVVIVNKMLMHPDGSGPVRNLDVNFGWQAIALFLALILATPVSWSRKGWGLLWGLLALHGFFLLFLGFCIWGESAEISLVNLSPFWKEAVSGCREAVAGQVDLAVPVVIWILVTFRRGDWTGLPVAGVLGARGSSSA